MKRLTTLAGRAAVTHRRFGRDRGRWPRQVRDQDHRHKRQDRARHARRDLDHRPRQRPPGTVKLTRNGKRLGGGKYVISGSTIKLTPKKGGNCTARASTSSSCTANADVHADPRHLHGAQGRPDLRPVDDGAVRARPEERVQRSFEIAADLAIDHPPLRQYVGTLTFNYAVLNLAETELLGCVYIDLPGERTPEIWQRRDWSVGVGVRGLSQPLVAPSGVGVRDVRSRPGRR